MISLVKYDNHNADQLSIVGRESSENLVIVKVFAGLGFVLPPMVLTILG